jgi:hypothetical protein
MLLKAARCLLLGSSAISLMTVTALTVTAHVAETMPIEKSDLIGTQRLESPLGMLEIDNSYNGRNRPR